MNFILFSKTGCVFSSPQKYGNNYCIVMCMSLGSALYERDTKDTEVYYLIILIINYFNADRASHENVFIILFIYFINKRKDYY